MTGLMIQLRDQRNFEKVAPTSLVTIFAFSGGL